jgi:TIR domain
MSNRPSKKTYEYEVALSFAGEDRAYAEELARLLRDNGVKVFYDEFLKATLWGKDLYQHLQTIYQEKAEYCVVFVSRRYVKKNWTKHELRHAQSRSFISEREYILPLRLDDTVLPGLAPTIGYIDWRTSKPIQIAVLLLEKLGKPIGDLDEDVDRAKWTGDLVEYNGMMVASFWPKRIEKAQHKPSMLITRSFDRIRYGQEAWIIAEKITPRAACHDCGVLIAQYHVPGCDVEECPSCGGQQISCGCKPDAISQEELIRWQEDEDIDTNN